ncbi:hypothetical protein FRB90_012331 [Tulasnella sp. 427]|nr:hypothetical protein FRB90_012331 [Tulasnella sp. 427]
MSIHDFAHAGCIDFPRLTCLELQRRLHHLSMRTKTALTLVCKSWYPLAKRILFGSVRISDQKQVEILLHLLSSELKEGKVGSASSAWWIKELWFDTTICTCSLPAGSNALAQLLLLCPRLLAFRKFGRSDCGADDIQEINTVLGPLVCGAERSALRNLDLAFSNSWSFEYFLAAHPALQNELPGIRYMELRPSYISLFESPEAEGSELRKIRPTFPSLTSLRLLGSLCVIQAARFNLPYIRSLALYSTTFDRVEDYYHIPTVLQAHGSNLVELELDLPLESLPNLQNACPKLQRLQVPATVLLDAQLPSISHSGVHTLGLFGMQKLVYEQKHHVFTSSLTEALGNVQSPCGRLRMLWTIAPSGRAWFPYSEHEE